MDCKDSLVFLKGIETDSVDYVQTDPPYYVTEYPWDCQWKFFQDYCQWLLEHFKEFERILKDGGSLHCFLGRKGCAYIQNCNFEKLILRDKIIWYYRNGFTKHPESLLSSHYDEILFYTKGKPSYFDLEYVKKNVIFNVIECSRLQKGWKETKYHATQKPLKVVTILLKMSCPEDGLAVDPFAGSGTLGIACEKYNRRFILNDYDCTMLSIFKQREKQEIRDEPRKESKIIVY